jgi:hypothetical protein
MRVLPSLTINSARAPSRELPFLVRAPTREPCVRARRRGRCGGVGTGAGCTRRIRIAARTRRDGPDERRRERGRRVRSERRREPVRVRRVSYPPTCRRTAPRRRRKRALARQWSPISPSACGRHSKTTRRPRCRGRCAAPRRKRIPMRRSGFARAASTSSRASKLTAATTTIRFAFRAARAVPVSRRSRERSRRIRTGRVTNSPASCAAPIRISAGSEQRPARGRGETARTHRRHLAEPDRTGGPCCAEHG